MDIKKTISDLLWLYRSNRNTGTTTILQNTANTKDVFVVVSSKKEAKEFGKGAISMTDLGDVHGHTMRPVFMDNHAMMDLLTEVEYKIELLEEEKRKLSSMFDEIFSAAVQNGYVTPSEISHLIEP